MDGQGRDTDLGGCLCLPAQNPKLPRQSPWHALGPARAVLSAFPALPPTMPPMGFPPWATVPAWGPHTGTVATPASGGPSCSANDQFWPLARHSPLAEASRCSHLLRESSVTDLHSLICPSPDEERPYFTHLACIWRTTLCTWHLVDNPGMFVE